MSAAPDETLVRFPAEWEPQAAIVIAWPHASGDFRNLAAVEQTYDAFAAAIANRQPLIILCRDAAHQAHISRRLSGKWHGAVFIQAPVNDIWVRDTVFLTVEQPDGKAVALNFRFNGWGNKYQHVDDDELNQKLFIHPLFRLLPQQQVDFVLEGGSVESDGQGNLLTTRTCLLNANRNPGIAPDAIEALLRARLGARRVLWIEQDSLAGDDTDAHVDTLARFCSPDTIAYTSSMDVNDPHHAGLEHLARQLQALRTPAGQPYRCVPLPLPQPVYDETGQRLPANYANFLILNTAVLVPVYDDPMDAVALERLRGCFPGRDIVPVPCRPLVHQFGSLHCASMQIPASAPLQFTEGDR